MRASPTRMKGAPVRLAATHRPESQRYRRPMTESMARRLFELVEPVASSPTWRPSRLTRSWRSARPMVWDAYFAGRAAPLGRDVPPTVVHSLFYNFADGEVARHIPRVWDMVTPQAASAAREQGSVAASAADPRRPRRYPRRRPCSRPGHQRWDQRRHRGTGALRRGANAPRARPNRWRGSGTGPTCFASTAATATSPHS